MHSTTVRVIAVMNQKGGVGKTTTVANLGTALARLGRRVLLLDLDPQAHLTASLGLRELPLHPESPGIFQVLDAGAPLQQAALPLPCEPVNGADSPGSAKHPGSLAIVPGSLALAGADVAFASRIGRELLLRRALAGLDPTTADILLMDCPPNLGVLTLNALCAAGEVLVPVQAEYLALQSLAELLRTMDAVREQLNPGLTLGGVVLTRFSRSKTLNREVAATLREHFPDQLYETRIRENVALAEAPGFGQDIFRYRPGSAGALDYLLLAKELLSKEK
ncbi:ParA family protein [Megalodesulfovibrio paquesii]